MSSQTHSRAEERVATEVKILGRRRRFLVPGGYQKRTIVTVAIMAAFLLGALDFMYYRLLYAQASQILQVAPELRALIKGQDRFALGLVMLGSCVAWLGIVAIALFETHKTAGPVYNLTRTMNRIAEEGGHLRLKFRKDDHFKEMEQAFNRMVGSLEVRAKEHAENTARIATVLREEAEGLGNAPEGAAGTHSRLHNLAAELDRMWEEQMAAVESKQSSSHS